MNTQNDQPTSARYEKALEIMEKLEPGLSTRTPASLGEFDRELTEIILSFAFADVLARPKLDLKTREMLTLAALTAMGTAPAQLELHVRAALNVGVTRDEIVEIMLQMAVYAGVPACVNGVAAAKRAFTSCDK